MEQSNSETSVEVSAVGDISFMRDDLNCGICYELCINAVESPCCGHLFCERCVKNVMKCPMCREHCKFRSSTVLRRLISNMKQACQFCQHVCTVAELRDHETTCVQRVHFCSMCSGDAAKIEYLTADLLAHMVADHSTLLIHHNDSLGNSSEHGIGTHVHAHAPPPPASLLDAIREGRTALYQRNQAQLRPQRTSMNHGPPPPPAPSIRGGFTPAPLGNRWPPAPNPAVTGSGRDALMQEIRQIV